MTYRMITRLSSSSESLSSLAPSFSYSLSCSSSSIFISPPSVVWFCRTGVFIFKKLVSKLLDTNYILLQANKITHFIYSPSIITCWTHSSISEKALDFPLMILSAGKVVEYIPKKGENLLFKKFKMIITLPILIRF